MDGGIGMFTIKVPLRYGFQAAPRNVPLATLDEGATMMPAKEVILFPSNLRGFGFEGGSRFGLPSCRVSPAWDGKIPRNRRLGIAGIFRNHLRGSVPSPVSHFY
jgi:hypothetical protein